jgi:type I restriction enzyme, S subunit
MRQPVSRSCPAIQEIPERRETFFRLSPAVEGKASCFAVKRGEITVRLDAFYNLPEHRELEKRLLSLAIPVFPIGDKKISEKIIEGRITPLSDCYSDEPNAPVFLRAQNVEEGHLNFSDAKRLTPESFHNVPDAVVGDDDIVLTIDGALLGKAAVHEQNDEPCCVSNHMVRIRHGTKMNPRFLAWFLNSPVGQKQIKRGITGSAIPGIRTDAIERILVPVPIDQNRFVSLIENARALQRQKLAEADALLAGFDGYLLAQLGLAAPAPDARQIFAVRLGQLRDTGRVNADYFHPERILAIRAMEKNRKTMRVERLRDIADFVRDAVPAETSENYLGLANVQSNTGELVESTEEDGAGLCFRFAPGDVLFARLINLNI